MIESPKGVCYVTLMDNMEISKEIETVVDRLLGPDAPPETILTGRALDTSRPNIHDSKAEFQSEMDAVDGAIEHLDEALKLLHPRSGDDSDRAPMAEILAGAVDRSARQRFRGLEMETAGDLARKNVVDTGLYMGASLAIVDLVHDLSSRKVELEDQEKAFWSSPNRPPHHYARTIALRLARVYARNKGKKPTFGTSRDGGHPSTEYGRALEEIFELLNIKSNVKTPAKWAIGQLTEEDIKPKVSEALGSLQVSGGMGLGGPGLGALERRSLAEIASATAPKGPKGGDH